MRRRKLDFNDYLILAQAQSLGAKLETFDKKCPEAGAVCLVSFCDLVFFKEITIIISL